MNKVLLPIKSQVASFDVDCQNTFTPVCPNELPVPEGASIVKELNSQAQFAAYRMGSKDAHSLQAVWIADEENPQFSTIAGENVDIRWVAHAIPGTLGFELIDGLPPVTQYDYFVWKGIELDMHPYGACYHDFAEKMSTGVIEYLKNKNVTTIVVGGLATDYCVKNTVLQLLSAEFKVIVNLGACRGISEETMEIAKHQMKQQGAVFIDSASQLQNSEDSK
jgi:nicotinamidase/pyrazinamidase